MGSGQKVRISRSLCNYEIIFSFKCIDTLTIITTLMFRGTLYVIYGAEDLKLSFSVCRAVLDGSS